MDAGKFNSIKIAERIAKIESTDAVGEHSAEQIAQAAISGGWHKLNNDSSK